MNTATITTADKGQRSALADLVTRIRAFAIELYAAHGGWFVLDAAQPASGALAAQRRARLKAIAK
jgi:hypothetical protein